jgi:hypothetical protein
MTISQDPNSNKVRAMKVICDYERICALINGGLSNHPLRRSSIGKKCCQMASSLTRTRETRIFSWDVRSSHRQAADPDEARTRSAFKSSVHKRSGAHLLARCCRSLLSLDRRGAFLEPPRGLACRRCLVSGDGERLILYRESVLVPSFTAARAHDLRRLLEDGISDSR